METIAAHEVAWRRCMVSALLLVGFPVHAYAQTDTVAVPADITAGGGNLNRYVDSARVAGTLSTKVFMLQLHGRYVLTDSIFVPAGEHLTIVAPEPGATQETAPPQILWDSTAGIGSYFFVCQGDLTLKNTWLFSANENGDRISSCIIFNDDPSDLDGRRCNFEGVILDYFPLAGPGGGTLTVNCNNFRGFFRNSYWKNNTDYHFQWYGRAVSFPFNSAGLHGDSVVFENCTFANIGYVLMQEMGEYYDYVKFNHCTFLNVLMFSLESGWWNKLSVTNSIFVNAHMMGEYIPQSDPYGATLRIDSLAAKYYDSSYAFPFTEQDRRILFANSSHHLQKWVRDWMWDNPYSVWRRQQGEFDLVPVPEPMLSPGTLRFFDSTDSQGSKVFPYMNRANLYDSTDPGFYFPPTDTGAAKSFIYRRWNDASDTNWAWKPVNSVNGLWPLEENLAYTNDTLETGGMAGFPLGDLYHWWPDKYQQWKVQATAEDLRINTWLTTGMDPGGVDAVWAPPNDAFPLNYSLSQNYPNPFNPATRITYSLPKHGYVSLKVYNLLGQEVASLFEGFRNAGTHVSEFDAAGLPSGMYFCRLNAGEFISTKKMTLLR